MELVIIILLLTNIFLLYLLNKKSVNSFNTATIVNREKTDHFNKKFIVDELDDFLFVLDKFNTVKYLNKSSEKRFGLNLIDKNVSSIIRDSELIKNIEISSKQKITKNIKIEITTPSFQYYDIFIIPGPTNLYPVVGSVVLFIKDLTEIIKAQKFRTDFVANVSHELRTPLMSIKGSIETIEDAAKDDPKAQKKFRKIILDQSNRMQTLIDDLLILSRIELDEHIRPNDKVNVNDIFDQIESNFELIMKEKNINLLNSLDKPTEVIGDYNKLFTLFSNLVDNSIKYSLNNTRIEVHSEIKKGKIIEKSICVSVKDQGIGIPKKHIDRITERFYRVDENKSHNVGGTGLGLAIMKHIITQHRGDYEILSDLGKGTEVKIYLPTT
ncbi:MAG: two-component sensor histidine kinase [Candidatus Pelagibacter sp.]|nr:two-component sensor histidine kinase [Candidatus Pelagibacter sp.]